MLSRSLFQRRDLNVPGVGNDSEDALASARRLVGVSRHAVAFTGAGISTASGVSDFRSPGGIWSRYRPVTIQEFLASEEARRRYWLYKKETYAEFAGARPNAAHLALARLEAKGRLLAVITQNVDGLHQDAGSQRVLELHGTNRRVECLTCRRPYSAAEIQDRLVAGCAVPLCDSCAGPLKPATVSFGQSLPADVLASAFELARTADLLLVLGSSLAVHPAAAIPEAAARAGVPVLIVNREATPLDHLAVMALRGPVEEVLPAVLDD
jgi:NAD-dependent deacetylase